MAIEKTHSNEERVEHFKKQGLNEVGGVAPVEFDEFEVGYLFGRHTAKDGDLLMHLYWREPPPQGTPDRRVVGNGFPDQPVYAPWPKMFREVAFQAVKRHFRLEGREDQILIEWVPELSSWCVTVKGVANIVKPSSKLIQDTAFDILRTLEL